MNKLPADVTRLGHRRLHIALAGFGLMATLTVLCSQLAVSDWRTAALLIATTLALTVASALRNRDVVLARLLVFGLAMGMCELAADAYLVDVAKTLDYSIDGGSPRIWSSPIYMPAAWLLIAMQFAVIGDALRARYGRWGLIAVGALGAAAMAIFEELARGAHWWRYLNCRMADNIPYHLVVSYVFVITCIAYTAPSMPDARWPWLRAVAGGALSSLVALIAFAITYKIIG